MPVVSVSSEVGACASAVWERATTLAGVNAELRPLLRMTAPRALRGASITDLEPGATAGRSWLLLGGLIPVDYDDLCIAEQGPGHRFLERSQMGAIEVWQHERRVEPTSQTACRISDVLEFELRGPLRRLPGAERLATAIVSALFAHRHRRLARMHGGAS